MTPLFQLVQDDRGLWRWQIMLGERCLAVSGPHSSEADCNASLTDFRANAPDAAIVEASAPQ